MTLFLSSITAVLGMALLPVNASAAESQKTQRIPDPLPVHLQALGRSAPASPDANASALAAKTSAEKPLDPAACLKRLPPASAAPVSYREIYEKFRQDICVNHLAGEPTWQKCVVRSMEGGGFPTTEVSTAYNECEPGYVACTRQLGVGTHQGSSSLGSFVRSICLGGGIKNITNQERSCMLGLARQSDVLSVQPDLAAKFCVGQGAACFKKLRPRFGVALDDNSALNELGRVCDNTEGGHRMKECLESMRGPGKFGQILGKCEAKLAKEAVDCPAWVDEAVQAGTLGENPNATDRKALCSETPGTRACIVTLKRELRRGMRSAWYICQFADREVRKCVKDFVQGEGAFDGSFDVRRALTGETLDVIALDSSRGPQRKLLNAEFACTGATPFEQSCRTKVLRKIRVLGGAHPLVFNDQRSRELARQVCDTGSAAMQDCVLARRYAKTPGLDQVKADLVACADKTVQKDLPAISAIAAPIETKPCP